jgi:hypothetical protein
MTVGCCPGQDCFTARAPSPLATLADIGESGEFGGQGWVSLHPAGVAGSPTTQQLGEARWRGSGRMTVLQHGPPPNPSMGGGEVGGRTAVRLLEG